MARLPSLRFLIQQIGDDVVLFEDYTERTIARFNPEDRDAAAQAQQVIAASDLDQEDKVFAHFWCGYFYAYLSPAEQRLSAAVELIRKYGDKGGAGRKQWVLDQVLGILTAGTLHLEDRGDPE